MRHAAGENENAKANEHPVEGQITPFTNEIQKGKWNEEVGSRDQKVRDQMQPYQARTTLEKFHPNQTNFLANAFPPTLSPAEPNPWHCLFHVANGIIPMIQA
jgi:hypothetical protein